MRAGHEPEHAWMSEAACRGPASSAFFPPSAFEHAHERVVREERAKAVCTVCLVKDRCLAHALDRREVVGIWGGMTVEERAALRT